MNGFCGPDFWKQVADNEERARASPSGLADVIEALREQFGAGDHAWVDIVDQNLPTILAALRRAP